LARNAPDRGLHVIHIETPEIPKANRIEAIDRLRRECEAVDVRAEISMHSEEGGVFRSLLRHMPEGPDVYLLCGARVRSGRKGFLSGTVSEQLLKDQRFGVIALRVLQPGLLGIPHNVLVPVSGSLEGLGAGAEILRLLAPEIHHLQLLRVMTVKHLLFRRLGTQQVARLVRKGEQILEKAEGALCTQLGLDEDVVDTQVAVSGDWAQETVIAANQHKSHLICLEAARHLLTHRFGYGNPLEVVLRDAPCDVAIYRGPQ
jgi:nucleotide-binding universal stress UspA family protein